MFSNPFLHPQQIFETWSHLAKDHLTRLEALGAQMEKLQGEQVRRAQEAIDETAKLVKEGIAQSHQLASEWRKLGFETSRKAAGAAT
jgi:hypothetical protein